MGRVGGKLFNCNYCNYCNRQHSLGIIFHTLTRPQLTLSAPNLEAINKQALTEDKFIPDTPETPPKRTKTPQNTTLKKPKYLNILSICHTDPNTSKYRFSHQKSAHSPLFSPKKHLFSGQRDSFHERPMGHFSSTNSDKKKAL